MVMKSIRIVQQGFTLIELMITVAIVAILAAVAVPAYFTYIEEAAISATLFNLKTMRVSVEDFRLNDATGQYPNTGGPITNGAINALIGWDPGNMGTKYNYTLNSSNGVAGPAGYTIFATDLITLGDDGNPVWVRCENNGQSCCFSAHPLTVSPAVPCPPGSF